MAYNNTFNINDFFNRNYGLPERPVFKKGKKKSILVYILFFWILIPLYFIKTGKYKAQVKEWDDAFNYRRDNWWKDYDKFYQDAFSKINLKEKAFDNCDVVEEQTQLIKPFYIYGPNFSGYYRSYKDGTYRSQLIDYTYLIFTEKALKVFRLTLDLLDLGKIKKSDEAFKYSKINVVKVSSETYERNKDKSLDADSTSEINSQVLYLNVGGEKYNFSYVPNDLTNDSIKGMKALIDNMED